MATFGLGVSKRGRHRVSTDGSATFTGT
jgi:hypothetical protein